MKNKILLLAVVAATTLVSCKKNYTCTYASTGTVAEYTKLNHPAAKMTKKTCELAGGVWAESSSKK